MGRGGAKPGDRRVSKGGGGGWAPEGRARAEPAAAPKDAWPALLARDASRVPADGVESCWRVPQTCSHRRRGGGPVRLWGRVALRWGAAGLRGGEQGGRARCPCAELSVSPSAATLFAVSAAPLRSVHAAAAQETARNTPAPPAPGWGVTRTPEVRGLGPPSGRTGATGGCSSLRPPPPSL